MFGISSFDKVKSIARKASMNSIAIKTAPINEKQAKVVSSRIGGQPDLPPDFTWPRCDNGSMSFIAQIDLDDAAKYDKESLLPPKGILYFFYDQTQQTWGFDPKDKGNWLVHYFDGDVRDLKPMPFPGDIDEDARFHATSADFSEEITLPPFESIFIDKLKLSKNDRDKYFDWMIDQSKNMAEVRHKLLGYPDIIQNEMQTECQLVSNGLYCGDSSGYHDPRAEALIKDSEEWILLLQIDSDDNAAMMWGDVGRLYFWIKKDDLAKKQFENTWLILQCG